MFGFGFENIETLDEDEHNERYHRPYTKMNKRKRDHKDKYKKTKSSGKIEIVNDCKMFPYPSTATQTIPISPSARLLQVKTLSHLFFHWFIEIYFIMSIRIKFSVSRIY